MTPRLQWPQDWPTCAPLNDLTPKARVEYREHCAWRIQRKHNMDLTDSQPSGSNPISPWAAVSTAERAD